MPLMYETINLYISVSHRTKYGEVRHGSIYQLYRKGFSFSIIYFFKSVNTTQDGRELFFLRENNNIDEISILAAVSKNSRSFELPIR